MRIKRFKARDVNAALRMIKDELGNDAVILNTRQINEGDGAAVEITAGIEYHPDPPAQARARAAKAYGQGSRAQKPDPGPPPKALTAPDPAAPQDDGALRRELAEVKELLLDMTHRQGLSERFRRRQDLLRLFRDLVDAELDPAIARALIEKTAASENGRRGDPAKAVKARLTRMLKTTDILGDLDQTGRRVVFLIGPSGVGKTTTLAKLAARWSVKSQMKTAIVTLDGYRLGAAEQLRTYARIIGLPVRSAQDKEEFHQAMDVFQNMNLVLIDTSSRVLTQENSYNELAGLVEETEDPRVALVLSAGAKDRDLAASIEKAKGLNAAGLIVAKTDETQRYGNVINNLIRHKTPVCFLTNGQKVPEDIIPATPQHLAEMLTEGRIGVKNE